MKIQVTLWSFLLAPSLAQYNYGASGLSSTSSSTSTAKSQASATSSAAAEVQTVTLGQNGLKFSPESLVVSPGNKVVFEFYPGGHAVAQSSFQAPCVPQDASSIFSGFIDSSSGPASKVFTLTVNSTDPIWLYCPQVGHCQAGMVGVINPPANGQTLDQYRLAAANTGHSSAPSNAQGGILGPANSATTSASGTSGSTSTPSRSDGTSLRGFSKKNLIHSFVASVIALGLCLRL
ncbi:uncharacterized protein PV09_04475 [Verruconis gallopava]|uniref:Phytocyanin domain-containing protein n=1 Tax=Verruconis gallopava TaxID=253628 RepID=A0A0D2B051_9PEZI|nr:uncharacterized protein PV09_04475 [Verruconis gallopava]KIW04749.1 hypothetical protein PV09_04475 [Verruconis gallopava]